MLLVSRLNEGRLIRLEREVTGRTACRIDSRNDLRDCDDRVEKVGEGSAPRLFRSVSGDDGWVGIMANKFLLGWALRISDMTESLGPEMVIGWSLGV
jgi:hypothetical protein